MRLIAIIVTFLGTALAAAATRPTTNIPRNNNTIPGAYIVEFEDSHVCYVMKCLPTVLRLC